MRRVKNLREVVKPLTQSEQNRRKKQSPQCLLQWVHVEIVDSILGLEEWRVCQCCGRFQFVRNLTHNFHVRDNY